MTLTYFSCSFIIYLPNIFTTSDYGLWGKVFNVKNVWNICFFWSSFGRLFLLQGRYKCKFSLDLIRLFLILLFYYCRLFQNCDYEYQHWHCNYQKAFMGLSLSLAITEFIVALIAVVFSCVYASLGGNGYRENFQRGITIYIW